MDKSNKRRSSRLQSLQASGGSNGENSVNGASTAKTRQAQSIGCRRTRSNSLGESCSTRGTTNKRRKRTTSSVSSKPKSDLTVSTDHTNETTDSENRRRTRSFYKQKDIEKKNVTPSPVLSTTITKKFVFASPTTRRSKRRARGSGDMPDDANGKTALPPGVVDLYRDQDDGAGTALNTLESPINLRARKRLDLTKQRKQQQQQKTFEHRERHTVVSPGGAISNSSVRESMTIDYVRAYGEEHWKYLHDAERAIICEASSSISSNAKSKDKGSKDSHSSSAKRSRKKPFDSPASPRSITSSLSWSTADSNASSMMTPNNKTKKDRCASVATDFNSISRKKIPQPHQSAENIKTMSIQPQLTPKMRSILVDWLIELSEHFSFGPPTLHLAVTMVDRVLASGKLTQEQNKNKNSSPRTERRRAKLRSFAETTTNPDFSVDDRTDCYDSEFDFLYNSDDDEDGHKSSSDESEDDKTKCTRCYLIPRDRFQLLGATCVWLACKVQETTAPKAKDIAYVSDHLYCIGQIKRMERRVCNALNFSFFQAPTPHHFLFEFMRASLAGFASEHSEKGQKPKGKMCAFPIDSRGRAIPASAKGVGQAIDSVFRDMAHYLLELGRLPYGPAGAKPSLLAAAAVYLARVTLGIPRAMEGAAESVFTSATDSDARSESAVCYWTPTLEHYTGYTQGDLKETVLEIHKYHLAAESCTLKAVFNKYKSKKYHRVALKTVVREEDLGFS
mmetsp:Transcript_18689/g.38563  ORF Transcript_18689/g.38563 Transcript_18689/m.38563 type:complete len:733 (-) Transcript_18689:46-2244(-)|eukprot:CAMPEP_0201148972 /NCGR_PEP_ID=MMETSP0851-20130426/10358_1 /ASSEMBLY_ACC=CAM_ASM_000631 /TAXON_ID=183588 /ORGANISM="Pseudo-nitzschia fraudulenta, Strain WWA7" /LENGTH=732 /DNA_ID=CAMNT_0047425271 /DNA_START=185 /DNA_END=2383 /DNA_ORIENTATION=+